MGGADGRTPRGHVKAPAPVTSPLPPSGPHHRADIEGLRGIAVLSVFAVHSVPDAVRGGFIGVDVFFVLSGYLIASITLHELDAGNFSTARFYARRIRRLLPALLVVLLACLVFAVFWAVPADAKAIGKHVVAGAAFVSNLVLWREAGYFDPSSETKPLLHLWSLGIEEQFYLLWPLFALLLARVGRWTVATIALALLASFSLNVVFVALKANAVFFLPPTRLWEMLVGVLLATWSHRVPGGPLAAARRWVPTRSRWHRWLPDVFAAAGVALLVGALVLIDKTDHFPGWWALLPTLATFLLLAAGTDAWVNRAILAQPVLMFYGRISYPLYLWHWPLLTFPVLLDYRLGVAGQIGLLVVAVVLAVGTYYLVEQPLRVGRLAPRAPLLLLGGLGLAGGFGGGLYASDGLIDLYPDRVQTIAREHLRQDPAAYRLGTCFQTSAQLRREFAANCIDRVPADAPLTLLWGDSFAASLYPGLRDSVASGALDMRLAQFTGPLCPPLLQASERHLIGCEEMNRVVIEQVRRERPAMVLLMGAWSAYQRAGDRTVEELEGLRETIRRLRELGVTRVVVVGSFPVWRTAQPRALLSKWRQTGEVPDRLADGFVPQALVVDDLVEDIARGSGAEFVSPIRLLCNPEGCEATVERGGVLFPMAHDEAHLTGEGSRRLAQAMQPQLLQAPAVPR